MGKYYTGNMTMTIFLIWILSRVDLLILYMYSVHVDSNNNSMTFDLPILDKIKFANEQSKP